VPSLFFVFKLILAFLLLLGSAVVEIPLCLSFLAFMLLCGLLLLPVVVVIHSVLAVFAIVGVPSVVDIPNTAGIPSVLALLLAI
jgi:hypothetical protein